MIYRVKDNPSFYCILLTKLLDSWQIYFLKNYFELPRVLVEIPGVLRGHFVYDLAIDFISILMQRPFYISIQFGMQIMFLHIWTAALGQCIMIQDNKIGFDFL